MATIYKCDKCGDETKLEGHVTTVRLMVPIASMIFKVDLCRSCRERMLFEIKRWLKRREMSFAKLFEHPPVEPPELLDKGAGV
jgi:hypothetical protein